MGCLRQLSIASALFLIISEAPAQFAPPVPLNEPNFGPGRIPASQARNFAGQTVTACGRVSNILSNLHAVNIGNPGIYGTAGADLVVFIPPQFEINSLFGKIICATSVVEMQQSGATMTIQGPEQITIIGGTGP